MQTMTLIILLVCIIAYIGFLFLSYVLITAPIAMPYLKAKTKKGMLLILKTDSGKHVLVATNKYYHNKRYGDFLPNDKATFTMCGITFAHASVHLAVPPSQEACDAAEKLKEARMEPYTDLRITADVAKKQGILVERDVNALYDYANAVSPMLVTTRIERRVAEYLAANRSFDFNKFMGIAVIVLIIMLGAGIAYSMIQGGGTGAVAESVTNAVSASSLKL